MEITVTIITVVYNSAATIEKTIQSVLSQTYSSIEYFVIDGGSTDGTIDIISRYKTRISRIISEKDKGIYAAMNKGLALASGELVYFLNSDDELLSTNIILELIHFYVNSQKPDLVCGQLSLKNVPLSLSQDTHAAFILPYRDYQDLLNHGLCQQRLFYKRECFKQGGVFNEEFRLFADFDWLLRNVRQQKVRIVFWQKEVALFNYQGRSHYWGNKYLLEKIGIVYRNSSIKQFIQYCVEATARKLKFLVKSKDT